MKSLAWIGIIVVLLSCSPENPSGEAKFTPASPSKQNGESATAPNVTIQQADVNEDGVISNLDLTAVSYYMGKKVPADATWRFSHDQITIGEHFWVRVDVHGKIGEQLNFELEGCDDGFTIMGGDDGIFSFKGEIIHGTVGSIENLTVLNYLGQKSASSAKCSLRATVISRRDGTEGESFTKELQLQNGKVALGNIDAQDFRQGTVSTTVSVDQRPTGIVKEYLMFIACRTNTSDSTCVVAGRTEEAKNYPSNGVVESWQLVATPTKDGKAFAADGELPSGKYLLIAMYGQKGADTGETLSMAARAVELD